MNGFVTTARFPRIFDVPVNFSQTELRRGKNITVCEFVLSANQRIELRSLTVNVVAVLTPGANPLYLNTAMELASVGLYRGRMICGPIAYAAYREAACTTNPFTRCVIASPGLYRIIVSNNLSNVDMAVAATGSFKFYY